MDANRPRYYPYNPIVMPRTVRFPNIVSGPSHLRPLRYTTTTTSGVIFPRAPQPLTAVPGSISAVARYGSQIAINSPVARQGVAPGSVFTLQTRPMRVPVVTTSATSNLSRPSILRRRQSATGSAETAGGVSAPKRIYTVDTNRYLNETASRPNNPGEKTIIVVKRVPIDDTNSEAHRRVAAKIPITSSVEAEKAATAPVGRKRPRKQQLGELTDRVEPPAATTEKVAPAVVSSGINMTGREQNTSAEKTPRQSGTGGKVGRPALNKGRKGSEGSTTSGKRNNAAPAASKVRLPSLGYGARSRRRMAVKHTDVAENASASKSKFVQNWTDSARFLQDVGRLLSAAFSRMQDYESSTKDLVTVVSNMITREDAETALRLAKQPECQKDKYMVIVHLMFQKKYNGVMAHSRNTSFFCAYIIFNL
ncbi:Translation initiation factor [Trichinella pseudospiralis]